MDTNSFEDGGKMVYIDNIQVQASPELSTMMLAGIGGAALLFVGRRRAVR